ncbi:MAG: HAD-IIIC family phosphatase [Bacteroidetes bacterium]|nr:HAD-IIIC family phosphatase [Bacteroidota bacterium]
MKDIKFADIIAANREMKSRQKGEPLRIAVLSNVTAQPLKEILEYALRSDGFAVEVRLGDYDQIIQESWKIEESVVVVLWEAANLVDGLPYLIEEMHAEEKTALLTRIGSELRTVADNLAEIPLVLWATLSSLPFTADIAEATAFDVFADECNAELRATSRPNMRLVDLAKIYASVSLESAIDWRGWYTSRSLYSVAFYKAFAIHVKPWLYSLQGQTSKVLLMDCDNTLWGGILGEEGEENIKLDRNQYPGNVFTEIQHRARWLGHRGVLLGLCSKNNADDVDAVLRDHRDMVLRDEDFTVKRVSWDAKTESIVSIASDLNLGIDSMVFLDDSAFEIGLVQEQLPEVTVYRVPEQLYRYPSLFRAIETRFIQLSRSDEDLARARQYREEQNRTVERTRHPDLESYLQGLGLSLDVSLNDRLLVPRIAQMTQKTNQFNLTTHRYTEPEIARFVESADADVIALQVQDRFGDSGISGVVNLRYSGNICEIDTMLLSCRVLGRSIEFVFMDVVCAAAAARNVHILRGMYLPTKKNGQVAEYFDRCGFARDSVSEGGDVSYSMKLADYKPFDIPYIKVQYASTDPPGVFQGFWH